MSLGVYIQGGIGPGGKCPGGTWPGVYVLGLHAWVVHVRRGEGVGFCPVTLSVMTIIHIWDAKYININMILTSISK